MIFFFHLLDLKIVGFFFFCFLVWSLEFSLKLLEQAEKTQPCANENQNWGKKEKTK